MPHLVILHTPGLETRSDIGGLCRRLADVMLEQRDENGKAVFPPGGTRVLAFPAAHAAVADGGAAGRAAGRAAGGSGNYGFAYLNLRMGRGRSEAVHKKVGDALSEVVRAHFAPLMADEHVGVTLQIDVGAEVHDAKMSSLHPLFNR